MERESEAYIRLGDDDGPKELSLTLDEAEVLAEALTQLIAEARAGAWSGLRRSLWGSSRLL